MLPGLMGPRTPGASPLLGPFTGAPRASGSSKTDAISARTRRPIVLFLAHVLPQRPASLHLDFSGHLDWRRRGLLDIPPPILVGFP